MILTIVHCASVYAFRNKQADFESVNNLLQSTPSNIIYDNDIDNFWVKWSLPHNHDQLYSKKEHLINKESALYKF